MFNYEQYAKIRDEKGLTDYAVCKAIGVTTAAMTGWKHGRFVPKYDKMVKIADTLGVKPEAFLESA